MNHSPTNSLNKQFSKRQGIHNFCLSKFPLDEERSVQEGSFHALAKSVTLPQRTKQHVWKIHLLNSKLQQRHTIAGNIFQFCFSPFLTQSSEKAILGALRCPVTSQNLALHWVIQDMNSKSKNTVKSIRHYINQTTIGPSSTPILSNLISNSCPKYYHAQVVLPSKNQGDANDELSWCQFGVLNGNLELSGTEPSKVRYAVA